MDATKELVSFLVGDEVSLEGFKELYISWTPGSSVEVERKGKSGCRENSEGVISTVLVQEDFISINQELLACGEGRSSRMPLRHLPGVMDTQLFHHPRGRVAKEAEAASLDKLPLCGNTTLWICAAIITQGVGGEKLRLLVS